MLTTDTTVQIGLVITLMAAAGSFGIMFQKVQSLEKSVERLEVKIDEILSHNKF